jgi:tRNA A37 threonylcarbamoyladenosine modification protein TsaB
MILSITLTSHHALLKLSDEKKILAKKEFAVDNDLSQNLLVHIEEMLTQHNVQPEDLEHVEYRAEEAGFTTTRIGQAVANAFNYALKGKIPETESEKSE